MAALFLNAALRKRIDRVAVLQRARWRMEAGLLSLFWWISARLEPYIEPLDPATWRSPKDAMAAELYSWDAA